MLLMNIMTIGGRRMNQIVLASNSPRRKEILAQVGVKFNVCPSNSDESTDKVDPIELVEAISAMKAEEVADKTEGPAIIIGADTVVVHEGTALGKPKDEADAKRMLSTLQGNTHEVFTGVTVILKNAVTTKGGTIEYKKISFADVSKVIVHAMTGAQIDAYVATKEPMDKAGAYAIQGKFAVNIKEIIGDYYNIVGLPISKLYQTLLAEEIDLLA